MKQNKDILTTFAFILAILCLLTLFATAYAFDISDCAIPQEIEIPSDAYGVWELHSLNYSVPVYTSHGNIQDIIDAEDSAVIIPYGRCYRIGDHRGSGGKWYMDRLSVNDVAFMHTADGVVRYKCFAIMRTANHNGHYSINNRTITEYSSTNIICSCCTENGNEERYLAFFERVE